MNAYVKDIFSQPQALSAFAESLDEIDLTDLRTRIARGDFDRLIISGMGASYSAAYPAYLRLAGLPMPVMLVNAAELVQYLPGLIGPRTLLWLNSQSGRSAELVHLIENLKTHPAAGMIAIVNDSESPLARAANERVLLCAGQESTVSVKTYTNMAAANLATALLLSGEQSTAQIKTGLLETAQKIEDFLTEAVEFQQRLAEALTLVQTLFLLGRGASMAAVWTGSLINKEAAKCGFEGMNAADFRHGPLEMAGPGTGACIFAGDAVSAPLNRQLGVEIARHGGQVIWFDHHPDELLKTLTLPDVSDVFRPLVEIIPMQLLTLIMAEKKGIEPGVFQIVGKITQVE